MIIGSTGNWWFIHPVSSSLWKLFPFLFPWSCFFRPSGGLPGVSRWRETSLRTASLDLREKLEYDLWLTPGLSHLLSEMMDGEDALLVTWMSVVGISAHPWRAGTRSRPWVMLCLWNWLLPRGNLDRHAGNVEERMGHLSHTPRMTFYHIYPSKQAITGWSFSKSSANERKLYLPS